MKSLSVLYLVILALCLMMVRVATAEETNTVVVSVPVITMHPGVLLKGLVCNDGSCEVSVDGPTIKSEMYLDSSLTNIATSQFRGYKILEEDHEGPHYKPANGNYGSGSTYDESSGTHSRGYPSLLVANDYTYDYQNPKLEPVTLYTWRSTRVGAREHVIGLRSQDGKLYCSQRLKLADCNSK